MTSPVPSSCLTAVPTRPVALAAWILAAVLAGCGGSGDGTGTAASAAAGSRRQTLATTIPSQIPADANVKGMWSGVHDWPIIPIHAVLMPDGRVMSYGSRPDGSSTAYFGLDIWDNTGEPTAGHLSVANGTGNDIFCGSQLLLPPVDGAAPPNVFMAGGDAWNGVRSTFIGITGSSVFNAGTNTLSAGVQMSQPRWYSTSITLPNGETYIQGGFGGTSNPEVRQLDGTFRRLSTADTSFLLWSYPRNYVMPDGRVFGYDYEGRMYFVDPSGTGSVSPRTILPWQYFGTGSSAMFRPGRILQIGGNTNASAVIDVTSGNPVFTPTQSTSTNRKLNTATLLADGQVLITGGSPVWNELPGANRQAETWNPVTGRWTLGAEGARARLYHSTALLLPDASVLVGGGGAPAPVGGDPIGERNVEVYYPPYLFAANGQKAVRPAISGTPDWLEIGRSFTVQTTGTRPISRVTLVKTGSVTHGWNFDQRFLDLPFTRTATTTGSTLNVHAPARAGEATPGYYMLFVFDDAGVPSEARILRMGIAPAARTDLAPVVTSPGNLSGTPGRAVNQTVAARDPNGDTLRFAAAGLPPGLGIHPQTGQISGTPTTAGSYDVVVAATDGSYTHSATFVWTINPETALTLTLMPSPGASLVGSSAAFAASATGQGTVEYAWSFGDGSADTAWSTQANVYRTYSKPGTYAVTLKVRDASGAIVSRTFLQTVYLGTGDRRPSASSNIALEVPVHGRDRLWVVNQDNDSVSGFDTLTNEKHAEIPVGAAPRSIAVSGAGQLWVTNAGDSTITVIDPYTRAIVRTIALPRGSQPYGVAISPTAAQAFVALEGSGKVLRFDTNSFAQTGTLDVGPNVRHVSVAGSGKEVYVTRYITAPMPGEGTTAVSTPADRGGEVLQLDAAEMTLTRTIVLAHADKPDSESQGSGLPNYLGPLTISPDNSQGFVPGKQDNIKRGLRRNGSPLNFQNTVRAISSRVVLKGTGAGAEDLARRIDHDNASLASAVAYDIRGVLMFVALETSREVAVLDAHSGAPITRFDVGRAPQGLTLSADGFTLYVNNFMDRTVGVYDLRPLLTEGVARVPALATLQAVETERLSAAVLKGKQLFHDARDPRLAADRYMSCAVCHNDGGHDGRTWDLSHAGEGLRNTISLRGRAGGHGRLHWSANFDEVQDFEAQIRSLAGGTGLMPDAEFLAGTRSQPLGDAKAGVSADLDALAAYVRSLDKASTSPFRQADGSLSADAAAGKTVFAARCASCHGGTEFSDSRDQVLRQIGTVKAGSGERLGKPLAGIDTPTLRDTWATAPYLHDGSAPTLQAAVLAHGGLTLSAMELAQVVAYTQQIDKDEAAAPASQANLIVRALATLADSVGAWFEVRVDKTVVGSGQLDARGFVDLLFDVASFVKDSVVEIVFRNDATINGQDRNLAVQSITVNGSKTLAANAAGVTLDVGAGAAAFDGADVRAASSTGGWMPWDASMRIAVPGTVPSTSLTVRGRATLAGGIGAQIEVRINGTVVGSRLVDQLSVQDMVFAVPVVNPGDRIDVVFTNDAMVNGEDRNLMIESITVRGITIPVSTAGVVIDKGQGVQATDGLDLVAANIYGGWVPWNGAVRFVAP